jgi:Rps23 Pro-64 3,4-dihydroxylase Tpa1-like proline 4-hydroxylase
MQLINFEDLQARKKEIKDKFQSQKPFRFVSFENFFRLDKAEEILNAYPSIKDGMWDGTTYVDQKNKFRKVDFETDSIMKNVFKELNSSAFLLWLQDITNIEEPLIADEELFGGGLHQSTNGAYLNVHVDYNIHPTTKYHRRLNVLVYMNKDWKDEYEGHLELWDLSNGKKEQIAQVSPIFNRCVIFETNEISFHGHPKPLNTPPNINRKSIATYYYTKNRPVDEIATDHNTIFINTEGSGGQIKRAKTAFKALVERIKK